MKTNGDPNDEEGSGLRSGSEVDNIDHGLEVDEGFGGGEEGGEE